MVARRILALLTVAAAVAGPAVAQTAVTTSGGTSGTLPVFTGGTAVGNSAVVQSGSAIGIGMSPAVTLDINAGAASNAQVRVTSTGNDAAISFKNTGSGGREYWWDSGAGSAGVGAGNLSVWDATAGLARFSISPAGYVGIGNVAPSANLDVNGVIVQRSSAANSTVNYLQTNANNNLSTTLLNPGILFYNAGGNMWGADLGFGNGRYRTRLFAMQDVTLSYSGSTPTSQASFTDGLVLRGDSGFVGIGTPNPGARLEVNGGLKLTPGGSGSITFADGTTQSTAGVAPSYSGGLAVQSHLVAGAASPPLASSMIGTVTIASPAADGQGTPAQGLLFVDDFQGAGSAWTHAAIYTVGSSGYNGSLVFATDGDNQPNFGVTEKMRITASGNVGVGTSTPGADLAALPSAPPAGTPVLEVSGDIALTQGKGGQIYFQDGSIQSTAWNGVATGGDYAESVDVSGERVAYEPGDVLVIDPNQPGKFLKCDTAYSTAVAGIYSTKPGLRGRRQKTALAEMANEVPMAMVGIVPAKVTAESGSIRPGDLLVTSTRPGYAMKGTDRSQLAGAIVGKAMGFLDSGTGVMEVVVSLQ